MSDYQRSKAHLTVIVIVLIVLVGLYMTVMVLDFFKEPPPQEGIIVNLILFFKLNFSNISTIL